MVGMLKILQLRERAQTTLGAKFDIRDFHDVVLGNGAVPLETLENLVDVLCSPNSRAKIIKTNPPRALKNSLP